MSKIVFLILACISAFQDQQLKSTLLEMARQDQEVRAQWIKSPDQRLLEHIVEVDQEHLKQLKAIVSQYGWPGFSLVGEEGSQAMWLLVQHAKDLPFQKECLQLLEKAVSKCDASPVNLAYLTDRVRMHEGKSQIYGTQVHVFDQEIVMVAIEDADHVDERRAALGLCSLQVYKQQLMEMYKLPLR